MLVECVICAITIYVVDYYNGDFSVVRVNYTLKHLQGQQQLDAKNLTGGSTILK